MLCIASFESFHYHHGGGVRSDPDLTLSAPIAASSTNAGGHDYFLGHEIRRIVMYMLESVHLARYRPDVPIVRADIHSVQTHSQTEKI